MAAAQGSTPDYGGTQYVERRVTEAEDVDRRSVRVRVVVM